MWNDLEQIYLRKSIPSLWLHILNLPILPWFNTCYFYSLLESLSIFQFLYPFPIYQLLLASLLSWPTQILDSTSFNSGLSITLWYLFYCSFLGKIWFWFIGNAGLITGRCGQLRFIGGYYITVQFGSPRNQWLYSYYFFYTIIFFHLLLWIIQHFTDVWCLLSMKTLYLQLLAKKLSSVIK